MNFRFLILALLSVGASTPAFSTELDPPLKMVKRDVLARKETTFEFTLKNDRKDRKPIILANVSQQNDRDECRTYIPLEPILPGKSATLKVVCSFSGAQATDGGALRTPTLYVNKIVPGETPRLIPLQVQAQVYRKELPKKTNGQTPKEISGGSNTNFTSGDIRIQNSVKTPRLKLFSENCGPLDDEIRALSKLKEKIDGKAPKLPTCACDSNVRGIKRCFVTADSILPEELFDELNIQADCDGPNCFNTALRMSGLLQHPRYSSSEEFGEYLKSPLCREIPADAAPAPGDIIAIRDAQGRDTHAFTYLTKDLVYTKNGYSNRGVIGDAGPFSFSSPEEVFDEYDVPKSCERVHTNDYVAKGCGRKHRAFYYRCLSLTEYDRAYAKKHPFEKVRSSVSRPLKEMDRLECQISSYALKGNDSPFPMTNQTLDSLLDSLDAVMEEVGEVIHDNEREKVLQMRAYWKNEALKKQIRYLKEQW